MRIAVVGTGHVGLPTAVSLAHLGHVVVACDSDSEKVAELAAGRTPFYEEGLDDLLQAELGAGRLRFTTELAGAVAGAVVAFICVGTPPRASGAANLLALERVAEQIAKAATNDLVVVGKSTVPTGTAERLAETLARHGNGAAFTVVSSPEFLREGRAVEDSLSPSRIVIGSDSPGGFAVMREVYAPLIDAGVAYIETDIRTAELAKHACNAFLSLKISYANALARICELSGADVVAVADIMGSDPRIGRAHLDAGLGYGGYCFPKDLAAFSRLVGELGYAMPLLDEVARLNDEAVEACVAKVRDALWNLEDKRIALLGLSFKPGTDDVRFSPALALAARLLAEGARVVGYDPKAMAAATAEVGALQTAPDLYAALEGAHCAVVATDWPEFKDLDLAKAKELMAFPIVVDGRNAFDPAAMAEAGFTYYPTGRPVVKPGFRRA